MKRRLSEQRLHEIIIESIEESLSEIKNGWELEDDDITLVNDEESGSKRYMVKLWWGSGYLQDAYNVFAFDDEDALNKVVVWVEQNHPDWLEASDRNAENLKKEIAQEKGIDEYEAEEAPEFEEAFIYIDATMEGAQEPHYIYSENLQIEAYPESHNYPIGHKLNEDIHNSVKGTAMFDITDAVDEWADSIGDESMVELMDSVLDGEYSIEASFNEDEDETQPYSVSFNYNAPVKLEQRLMDDLDKAIDVPAEYRKSLFDIIKRKAEEFAENNSEEFSIEGLENDRGFLDNSDDIRDEMTDRSLNEEGDPWTNGTASWVDGEYDIPYGYHVEINTRLSYVAIEDLGGNEENSYFLQGDEADMLIGEIAKYWAENDCDQQEAVNKIISSEF